MRWVRTLAEMTKSDFEETGGKAANLGEMTQKGFNVPPAFCVTGRALDYVLESAGSADYIARLVATCDFDDYRQIEARTADIRRIISESPMPDDLRTEIEDTVANLTCRDVAEPFVAVRSSVSVRDSTISSFPGMMDTYHFVKGVEDTIDYVRQCWASLWTSRAAHRRHQLHIDHGKAVIAPVVQRMVDADVAGVLFTANPITSSRNDVVIEAIWGLGEGLVSGEGNGDWFVVRKGNPPAIVERRIAKKNIMVTVDREKGKGRKTYNLTREQSDAVTLSDERVIRLAELGMQIEKVFEYPQDVEWAYDGDELFILQSRKVKGLRN